MGGLSMYVVFTALAITLGSANIQYKMCIPRIHAELCQSAAKETTRELGELVCVEANDRMQCLEKLVAREADFMFAEPEDMYASKEVPNADLKVIAEIRAKDEMSMEFRYEAMVVVHKDSKVAKVDDLRGAKSCHTGVGRNVGYNIPLTRLKNLGAIGGLNDLRFSSRENELKALSSLFSKACIVGKWSNDPTRNKELKKKYSNLCALCDDPDKCDYPDEKSGYIGALKCLSEGGDVAWTKMRAIRTFFGLPGTKMMGEKSNEDPENYRFLCMNGTKVQITGPSCPWAARPWEGIVANFDVASSPEGLNRKIVELNQIAETKKADWLKIFVRNGTSIKPVEPISTDAYLDKSQYTTVLGRKYGPPYKLMKLCCQTMEEENKCQAIGRAAFSRTIRPRLECQQFSNCEQAFLSDEAQLVRIDNAEDMMTAFQRKLLTPIVAEYQYPQKYKFAVAVVKKESSLKSISDLQGVKSCHVGMNSNAAYLAPLNALIRNNLVAKSSIFKRPFDFFKEYFSIQCLPGSSDVFDVCAECETNKLDGCKALRCLVENKGVVAFIEHTSLLNIIDGKLQETWAKELRSSDFELLCLSGGRAPVHDYEACNLMKLPPTMILTCSSDTAEIVERYRHALLEIGRLYSQKPEVVSLFNNASNHLFPDQMTALETMDMKTFSSEWQDYENMLENLWAFFT